MKQLIRKLIFRYLYLIPTDDLATYLKDRQIRESMDKAYKDLSDKMIKAYFTEVE